MQLQLNIICLICKRAQKREVVKFNRVHPHPPPTLQILFFIFAPKKLPQQVGQQQRQKCTESHQQVGI